jgi:hypothetical protein
MAVPLIISYSSASLIVTSNTQYNTSTPSIPYAEGVALIGIPLLTLAVALLQVVIALSGMWAVTILTWSSSLFNFTAVLVHHTQLTPDTLWCMCCVSDLDMDGGPAKPSEIQPFAWHAHPSIQKVVIFLWVIIAACIEWAALITGKSHKDHYAIPITWSFLPNRLSS